MLTMTENAATAVKGILAQNPGNDDAGLRIFGADDPGAGFALTVATAEETDEVVETSGARVFISKTSVSLARALAKPTRCCIPPDISEG